MKAEFKGTLFEVQKQEAEWKAAHPGIRIIFQGAPMRVGHRDGEDIYEKSDWALTIEYEDGSRAS